MALTWSPKQFELARAEELAVVASLASTRPWIVSGLVLSAGTGLNVAISAGVAWIDGYYVEWDASAEEAVTGSATNHVWIELTRDGNDNVTAVDFVVNTTGVAPTGDNVKLGTATTDGSGVTGTATTGRSPQTQVLVESVFGRGGVVVAASGDYDADEVDYDNATSGLAATDVQAAVDELAARPAPLGWDGVSGLATDLSKNNTTFATLLSFSAAANRTYLVECMYMVSNGLGANKFQITVPASGTADMSLNIIQNTGGYSGSTLQLLIDIAAATSTNLNGSSGARQFVTVQGIVTTAGTAGTVAIEVAQQSASGTTVFKAGASLKFKDIT